MSKQLFLLVGWIIFIAVIAALDYAENAESNSVLFGCIIVVLTTIFVIVFLGEKYLAKKKNDVHEFFIPDGGDVYNRLATKFDFMGIDFRVSIYQKKFETNSNLLTMERKVSKGLTKSGKNFVIHYHCYRFLDGETFWCANNKVFNSMSELAIEINAIEDAWKKT